MQRVLIVGCPGAGKSTLAKELSAITGLPLIHLDRHYWLPDWERPDGVAWQMTIKKLLTQPTWIMDGNYSSTLGQRLAVADTLIHLDYSTWLCVWRVIRRTVSGWGNNRDNELAPGCRERYNWQFLLFVMKYRKEQRGRDLERMAAFSGEIHRFTSPAQLSSFVAGLKRS